MRELVSVVCVKIRFVFTKENDLFLRTVVNSCWGVSGMDIMMPEFSVLSCRQSDSSRKKDTRRCVKPNSETKQTLSVAVGCNYTILPLHLL